MIIRWTTPARRTPVAQIGLIAQNNPDAAERVHDAMIAAVERFAHNPHLGRPGKVTGTRELVVARFPSYIIVYRLTTTEVRITTIWHGRQKSE
jgi:plasmid stabilization system protein ParE